MALLLVGACGGHATTPTATRTPTARPTQATMPTTGGRLRYALGDPIRSWNIDTADGQSPAAEAVLQQVYPPAFVVPSLHASPVLNSALLTSATLTGAAPQVVTYVINPAARWSDGVPVTVADFRYLWRAESPTMCPHCGAADNVGYSDIRSVSGAAGGHTVTVAFRRPFGDWQSLFGAGDGLLPAHVAARHGGLAASFQWFRRHPPAVSAGPFTVTKLGVGGVTLRRNPRYAGDPAYLDQLQVVPVTDGVTAAGAWHAGRLDVVGGVSTPYDVAALKAEAPPGGRLTVTSGRAVEELSVNLQRAALTDRALRLALLTAVDRESLIDNDLAAVMPSAAPVDNRFFLPGQAGYRDDVTSTQLGSGDQARAEQILTDAAYRGVGTRLFDSNGHQVPPLTLSYDPSQPWALVDANAIANAVHQLGAVVRVQPVQQAADADLRLQSVDRGDFPALAPAAQLAASRGKRRGYANPQVLHFLRVAHAAAPGQAQTVALNDADLLMSQDAVSLPLYQLPNLLAVRGGLLNVSATAATQGPAYDAARWALVAQ